MRKQNALNIIMTSLLTILCSNCDWSLTTVTCMRNYQRTIASGNERPIIDSYPTVPPKGQGRLHYREKERSATDHYTVWFHLHTEYILFIKYHSHSFVLCMHACAGACVRVCACSNINMQAPI